MTPATAPTAAAPAEPVAPVPGPSRRRWGTRRRAARLVLDAALLLLAAVMVAPLVWLLATSLTSARDAFQLPPSWLPTSPTLDNFGDVFTLVPFGRMAVNSLLVAGLSVAGSLLTSLLAAYGFSRTAFPGREVLFVALLGALMVPAQLTVIPVFILMRNLGLVDTLPALWLPATVNVFSIFFLRQYFNSVPRDLDEAARIDGAGHLWILFRMLLPLSGPAVAAVVILQFQLSWNDYFNPLIFISSTDRMTLPLGLVTLQSGQGGGPAVVVFAAITLVVLPLLALFLAFQRHFVESIASSGIRG